MRLVSRLNQGAPALPLGSGPIETVALSVHTDCVHCAHPLPVNGISSSVHCETCQRDNPLDPTLWMQLLPRLRVERGELQLGTRSFHVTSRNDVDCVSCGAPIGLPPGVVPNVLSCSSCRTPVVEAPAPAWLLGSFPMLVGTLNGSSDVSPIAGAANERAQEPVLMACPACGASLSITDKTERTAKCQYCGANAYLPDDLWRKLHPVATMRGWAFRFRGPELVTPEAHAAMVVTQEQGERVLKGVLWFTGAMTVLPILLTIGIILVVLVVLGGVFWFGLAQ